MFIIPKKNQEVLFNTIKNTLNDNYEVLIIGHIKNKVPKLIGSLKSTEQGVIYVSDDLISNAIKKHIDAGNPGLPKTIPILLMANDDDLKEFISGMSSKNEFGVHENSVLGLG